MEDELFHINKNLRRIISAQMNTENIVDDENKEDPKDLAEERKKQFLEKYGHLNN